MPISFVGFWNTSRKRTACYGYADAIECCRGNVILMQDKRIIKDRVIGFYSPAALRSKVVFL